MGTDYTKMPLKDVCALPGVKDITPAPAQAKFGSALIAEARGYHEEAERLLNEAVAHAG